MTTFVAGDFIQSVFHDRIGKVVYATDSQVVVEFSEHYDSPYLNVLDNGNVIHPQHGYYIIFIGKEDGLIKPSLQAFTTEYKARKNGERIANEPDSNLLFSTVVRVYFMESMHPPVWAE